MSGFEQGLDPNLDIPIGLRDRVAAAQNSPSLARLLASASTFQRVVTIIELLADIFTCVLAVFASFYLYFLSSIGKHIHYPTRELVIISLAVGLLCAFLFDRASAYRGGSSMMRIRETERTLRISCETLILFLPLTWVIGQTYSRAMFLVLVPVLPALLLLQKSLVFSAVQAVYARGYGIRKVVIYGARSTGRRLFSALLQSPKLGYDPIAVVDHDTSLHGSELFELGYNRRRSVQVTGGPITEEYLRASGCSSLFVAIPGLPRDEVFNLLRSSVAAGVEFAFLPDHRHLNTHAHDPVDIDGLLLTFANESNSAWSYSASKWLFDLTVATVLLMVFSPILILIAILIRLDSPGPALFLQERIGLNGKPFRICKFRTMFVNAPKYAKSPVFSEDARITRVGRFLRKTSLDELPQLINVLRREMSLVGPRPEMPFIVAQYDAVHRERLRVVPGITGLWQISADRAFLIHENPEYDHYYIRHRGFFLDLAILLHTALFAMRGI